MRIHRNYATLFSALPGSTGIGSFLSGSAPAVTPVQERARSIADNTPTLPRPVSSASTGSPPSLARVLVPPAAGSQPSSVSSSGSPASRRHHRSVSQDLSRTSRLQASPAAPPWPAEPTIPASFDFSASPRPDAALPALVAAHQAHHRSRSDGGRMDFLTPILQGRTVAYCLIFSHKPVPSAVVL